MGTRGCCCHSNGNLEFHFCGIRSIQQRVCTSLVPRFPGNETMQGFVGMTSSRLLHLRSSRPRAEIETEPSPDTIDIQHNVRVVYLC